MDRITKIPAPGAQTPPIAPPRVQETPAPRPEPSRLLRKRYQNKRYRLKGYTTPSRVAKKYARHRRNNTISQVITIAIIVASLIALWWWIQPISLVVEILKTIGYS